MRNHIQITEDIDEKIKLTIHHEIKQNVWQKAISTKNSQIIKDFMREIKYEIISSKPNKEDLNIILKDQSTVTIKNYTKLKNSPILRPIVSKINNQKNRRKFKMARAAIISLGAFMGLSSFSKKISYAKEKEIIIESQLNFLESLNDITFTNVNTLTENAIKVQDISNITEIKNIDEMQIDKANLEIESDDLKELDSIIEEVEYIGEEVSEIPDEQKVEKLAINGKETAKEFPTNEETTNSIKEAIPAFGERGMDEKRTFVHENYGNIVQKYAAISGIDASIIECILAQERGEHSREIEPHGAIGIAQIQYNLHVNEVRNLYNVQTNETESFLVTDDIVRDLEGNIKTGVAILQDYLQRYEGNIFLAVQAYNYGHGPVNKALEMAENRTGISKEEMIHNPECLVWIEEIKNYKDGTYGDPNYLDNVFSRYVENNLTTLYQENPQIVQLNTNGKSL